MDEYRCCSCRCPTYAVTLHNGLWYCEACAPKTLPTSKGMDNLIPCPFCGTTDIEIRALGGLDFYFIGFCLNCGCEGPHKKYRQDAIDAWNTRAENSAQQK
jgi:Lar family restriction alleviation protein